MTAQTVSAAAPTVTPAGRSRRANIALWTVQGLLAAFFAIGSAAPKLAGAESAADAFDKIGYGDWYMYLAGCLELAGAIGLIVPILSGVASIALVGLMTGATVTTFAYLDGDYWFTPVVIGVVCAALAYARRDQTRRLYETVVRRRR